VLLVVLAAGCWLQGDKPFDFASLPATPPVHLEGERLFNANCSSCHGPKAAGTAQGPTLIHKIYEPSHHSDLAFVMAARRGVAPHHWRFGPMPAVPSVSEEQTMLITGYIRWIQRQAGIGR
jgi:mono/diheme cytochrome c family protein